MEPSIHPLRDGRVLVIREATADDAGAVLDHVEAVSGESDFLTFGPGEFELTEAQERAILNAYRASPVQLYILGTIGDTIVATLSFAAGSRPRLRHVGELSMSVRRQDWGCGIGSLMLDTLVGWARATRIVTKLNLRVRADHRRGIDLYTRKGFVHEGTIRKAVRVRGAYFDLECMGLEL